MTETFGSYWVCEGASFIFHVLPLLCFEREYFLQVLFVHRYPPLRERKSDAVWAKGNVLQQYGGGERVGGLAG